VPLHSGSKVSSLSRTGWRDQNGVVFGFTQQQLRPVICRVTRRLHFHLVASPKLPHLSCFENDHPPSFFATGHRFTSASQKPTRMSDPNLSSFIWSVADLLRGDYKQSEYGKVILPFTVLRRLDCVLEATKPAVLAELAKRTAAKVNPEPFLLRKSGTLFYNTSSLDLKKLMGDQDHIGENLRAYLQAFSPAVRDIFESFEFHTQIDKLAKSGLLYLVTEKFANIDLHPAVVSNSRMGAVFEELIRKFAEISNETAGEHFTPREVIRLMVNLLFIEDDDALTKPGVVRSIYDPTAGTGGMLSVAGEHLASLNPGARLVMYGQELNPESYAICKADMLIKGQDIANIIFGNTLSADGLHGKVFDYMLSNPPFGVEWKKIETVIRKEFAEQGHNGRFGPGLPRVSDGSLLFLLHLISKMRPAKDGGSRFGIVLNGSPLFTGGAGSGESEIRRYVLENDLVEAIIGLPTDMFYNTGISTYVWIVSNRKPEARKGRVQLIDASGFWQKMRKSLGSKRKELSPEHIEEITQIFGNFKEVPERRRPSRLNARPNQAALLDSSSTQSRLETGAPPISRIFKNEDFGYRTITVERPERDAKGKIVLGTKGKGKDKPVPDSSLRDTENVPLNEDVETYFKREVLPHAPDAWIDPDKTQVGYEIPFNRHFYVFQPPRPLAEIDAELKVTTDKILKMIGGLTQ
jgi:type I restriction enzyme M protein